jgi:hypothetical protein
MAQKIQKIPTTVHLKELSMMGIKCPIHPLLFTSKGQIYILVEECYFMSMLMFGHINSKE